MSNFRSYPIWLRIFAAIPIVALAAIMRAETLQVLGTRSPFLTFYPAVMIASLFGGLAGGSLATILSTLLASYLWIEPIGNFKIGDPSDSLATVVFVINCMMVSFITEVMNRTQARLKETEKQNALQESNIRYRTLFENMLNGFAHCKMLYDDQGHPADFVYLEVNRAFGLLTGLDDVIGKKATEIIPGIKESNAKLFEVCGRVARMGSPEKFEVEVEPLKKCFSIAVFSLEPDHFVAVFDNITDQKQAEKMLRKAHGELEQQVMERTADLAMTVKELNEKEDMLLMQSRMAAMGEMLSNIAHQWRQPLNSLGLRIQSVRLHHEMGNFTKEGVDKFVDDSMKQIHHMSQTIDDFRNFFRPDKAKTDFKVKDAINSTLSLLEGVMANKHIAIVAENLSDDLLINGYPNEYSQVLLNILTNAKDAFEKQRPGNPMIVITAGNEGGKSIVTVRDNAGGIPESIITKVFEPHFSTKGPGGTGIGLYMSKTIIERHMNGRLTARNTSEGAEFKIEV